MTRSSAQVSMKENDTNSFGKTLRALRKKSGLTQEELAYRVDVSLMTIRRWEWGESIPNMQNIKWLAEVLHVSEQQLLSPDREASRWVLSIKVAQDFTEEVINVAKGIPNVSAITTTPNGGYLALGGGYEMWADDKNFNQFIKDIKKARALVLQGMRGLSGITSKEDTK